MKAIVLAAGQGTRLRPLTDNRPKCLVEVAGQSILARAIASLETAGIDDIAVVTGYRADLIRAIGRPTAHNPDFATTNMVHSLMCAREEMTDEDVLIVYGDILFHPRLVTALMADPAPIGLAVNTAWRALWEERMDDPLSDVETLKRDERGHVLELGKKPTSYDDIQGQFTGLIHIRAEAMARVLEFYDSLDRDAEFDGKDFRNMYMTSLLQAIIDGLMPVKAVLVDGGWMEVDEPEDIGVAEAHLHELVP